MSVIHYGIYDQVELPTPSTYTPGQGVVKNPRKKILNVSLDAYTETLAALGYAWEAQPMEGTPYTVVTTITSPNLTTTWDLDGNDIEKPIWYLPRVRYIFDNITDLKVRAIARRNLEAFVRGDEMTDEKGAALTIDQVKLSIEEAVSQSNETLTGELVPINDVKKVIDQLIASMIRGVESFPMSAYVLRKTQILNPMTDVSPGFAGSNEIVTTATLIQDETTIPLNIRNGLPEGFWQKKTPQAAQSTDGRWTYRREFWWAQEIDEFLYPAKT